MRIERRERQFANGAHGRFRLRKVSKFAKLCVNGNLVRDPDEMMDAWCQHFRFLAISKAGELSKLSDMADEIDHLATKSLRSLFWMSLLVRMRSFML